MKTLFCALLAVTLLSAAGEYSNRRAPGFSLADSHYQQHDPQDYRGKVLLIDVVATTCPVCNKLTDVLAQVKAKFGDKVAMISILTMPDNFQTGDRFALQHQVTWPIVFDSGQVIASYLKVTPSNPQIHFPHLFIVDRQGTIKNDFDGTDDKGMTVADLSAEVEKLLK